MSVQSSNNDTSNRDADQSKTPEGKNTVPEKQHKDPVRRITQNTLIVVVFLFVWYILADRLAPWTDQARVEAYVVPIVPEVSGIVMEVFVDDNQAVKSGEPLLNISPLDYELAVTRAETSLELAGQEIGAGTAAVSTAQANYVEAQAHLSHMLVQSKRIFEVEKKGVVSKSEGDKARAKVKQARAQVDSAHAELEKAKQQLGESGSNNPKIQKAAADLKQSRLDLKRTTLFAPSDGGITNLKVDAGYYANAGTPLMTFIAYDDVWIQANLRENSVANIKVGNPVDIALDVAPGRIFKGRVLSLGFAVNYGKGDSAAGSLETIQGNSGWLRDAQRFPVKIAFSDQSTRGLRRHGSQADVQFYGDNPILNALGWLWIRVLSWFSYIY